MCVFSVHIFEVTQRKWAFVLYMYREKRRKIIDDLKLLKQYNNERLKNNMLDNTPNQPFNLGQKIELK